MRKDKASTKLGKKKKQGKYRPSERVLHIIILWLSNDYMHVQSHWCY